MSELTPKDWEVKTIESILENIIDYRGKSPPKSEVGIPLLTAKNIRKGFINIEPREYIYEEQFESWMVRGTPKSGDIFITTEAPLGNVARVPDYKFAIGQRVLTLSPKRDIVESEYLLHIMQGGYFKEQLDLQSTGSTVAGIKQSTFRKIPLPVPPLPEQKKIAKVLTSVDEVIEKTKAQINKLKDLKTGMMQELLTSGIGHAEFKDSPIGRIPIEWNALALNQVAKLSRGRFSHRPRNDPNFYNGQYPFLQTGDIPKESPYITKFSQSLNDKGLGVSKIFSIGTLVITIAATIGEVGILKFDSCFPDSLVGIEVKKDIAEPMFVLYVMRYFKDVLEGLAPQTAQKNINLDILAPFVIPVPPITEQKLISNSLISIDRNIEKHKQKLVYLQNTKKALMQDLLTGKVRVKVDS